MSRTKAFSLNCRACEWLNTASTAVALYVCVSTPAVAPPSGPTSKSIARHPYIVWSQ
jgi:hypothetical protein